MPVNNALTPEGQNSLGAAFGYFPQLRRNRTVQDPRLAADVPLQFLRGRAAATLGAPSDILNFLRTPLPMEMAGDVDYGPQVQVPYGSQELLRTLPLPPQGAAQAAAGNVGAVVPLSPAEALAAARAARQAAFATGRTLGPTAARMSEDYLQRQGLILPLDVYHGSPYKLAPTPANPLGEFDASKIGSGAGAQRYGHGIYTSEAPQFADMFAIRKKLPDVEGIASQNGLQLSRDARVELIRQSTRDSMGKPTKGDSYIDPVVAVRRLQNANIEARQMPAEKLQNTIREFQDQNKAYLYKADLPDEKIARMLDWEKPLSEQHPDVRAALKGIEKGLPEIPDFNLRKYMDADPLASTFHGVLQRDLGIDQADIAKLLRQRGIPGITYKDLNTRNFVTFPGEEKSMKILERKAR